MTPHSGVIDPAVTSPLTRLGRRAGPGRSAGRLVRGESTLPRRGLAAGVYTMSEHGSTSSSALQTHATRHSAHREASHPVPVSETRPGNWQPPFQQTLNKPPVGKARVPLHRSVQPGVCCLEALPTAASARAVTSHNPISSCAIQCARPSVCGDIDITRQWLQSGTDAAAVPAGGTSSRRRAAGNWTRRRCRVSRRRKVAPRLRHLLRAVTRCH